MGALARGPAVMAKLRRKHDDLSLQRRSHMVFHGYKEPPMRDDFYPTYKRIEGAPPIDPSDPTWPASVYRIAYKEPLYKGGRIKARVPGWCDRILYHSLPQCAAQLQPVSLPGPDGTIQPSYRCMHSHLTVSDHAPVTCRFSLTLPGEMPSVPVGLWCSLK